MTSKTFKSEIGHSLTIEPSDGHNIGLETTGRYLALKIEDAPALALAILEAAGVEPDREPLECQVSLGTIVADLQATIKHGEALAAAARERAELEAEALELVNDYRAAMGYPTVASFDGFSAERVKGWLAVARRAREMRAEK